MIAKEAPSDVTGDSRYDYFLPRTVVGRRADDDRWSKLFS